MHKIFLIFISLVIFQSRAQSAEVISFFPTGSVKQVQQVTVRFSSDMVNMGDPRSKTDPFKIDCKAAKKVDVYGEQADGGKNETPTYTTRWADTKNWILDFAKPLKSGMRCSFNPKNETKDLSGANLTGMPDYTFSTAGPALLGASPIYGSIEPEQYFVLLLDGGIDLKSLESLVYFEVQGMPDKVGVKIINENRNAILKAAIKDNWRWNPYEKYFDAKKITGPIKELQDFIIIGAKRRFPESARVILHWPKGILSKTGLPVEEAQKFEFNVMPSFEANFSCERTAPERPCNPILNMYLNFNSRLPLVLLKEARLVAKNGQTWIPKELKEGDQNKNGALAVGGPKSTTGFRLITQFADLQVNNLTFEGPFPESTEFQLILPKGIKDEIERPLINQNQFPLSVKTDEYSPLIKFSASFGILEAKTEALLPVSVRNVEKTLPMQSVSYEGKTLSLSNLNQLKDIINWYQKVQDKDFSYSERGESLFAVKNQAKSFQIPKPSGEREFELIGIPFKKPGFYVVEMLSPKLGQSLLGAGPMYVASSVLVTDMAVHLKKGKEASLVWVTQLSTAKPVVGAQIVLVDREGKELAKGVSAADGSLKINGPLLTSCGGGDSDEEASYYACEVFVFAQKGEDISFVSSAWQKGIESYRFNIYQDYESSVWGPSVGHTILNRMLAQPGDLIQMKHVLRERHMNGFTKISEKYLPRHVFVVHQGSRKTYTLPFKWDPETGSAINDFSLPKEASLGRYDIYLSSRKELAKKENGDESDAFDWTAMPTGSFTVAEYRLPLMKADVKIKADNLVQPKSVSVDLSASYLSGGPAKNLKVKLRSYTEPSYFIPDLPGASEFNFFAEPIKVGIEDARQRNKPETHFLKVQDLTLNAEGGALATITNLPIIKRNQRFLVEMEYSDPNGEVKTASTEQNIFPSNYIIGLRSDNWYIEPGKASVVGVVTNNKGKVQKDRPYTVEAFKVDYITHRKRLMGGFYSYDSKTETTSLGKVCEGKTDFLGNFKCEPKKLPAGSITLQAKTVDDQGRATYATVSLQIYEEGYRTWWVPSDSDRIDLLPEKKRYEPGEKAKFVVRTPYPTATVLVTLEREGVLESFVTEVKRDNPSIEIPIKDQYAPNVFVSALLVRGRVGEPQPTALLDLSKPAMKMGLTEIQVGWKAHELKVELTTDKKKYQAREKVQVKLKVKTASGAPLPAGTEIAVAAVDEALLRLKENSSWEILRAMMGERGLSVATSSGQNQVIGKRHFGSKAKAPGGGGGFSLDGENRQLFEPMLMWNPKLKLNAQGEVEFVVPLNDSMSRFRIVAVATGGEQFFGDGKVSIESSKDLMIYSGFAPLVREGDKIKNVFTLRNTTSQPMRVHVDIQASAIPILPSLPEVDLKPSEAKTLDLPLSVPQGIKEIIFKLKAKDLLSKAEDSLVSTVRVEPSVPPRVLQATLFQLEKTFQIPLKQPADALPGVGGIRVSGKATLVSGLAGVKSYMQDYSYSCLEQKVSKAVVAEDSPGLSRINQSLPSYMDHMGLLKFFPRSLCGSSQLTRYVMNIFNENAVQIPPETLKKLVGGLTAFVQGQYNCLTWWDSYVRDQYSAESKILLMETLSRYKFFKPEYLSTVQITPNLWKTETLTAWFQLLKREAGIANRESHLKQAENILRSRVNFQGSLMNLQGQLDWEAAWRLFSSNDQEALGVFGLSIDETSWNQDVGRMARGVTARLRLGHWDTTMANAWGVTYLRKFSRKYENEKVTGDTQLLAGEIKDSINWKSAPAGDKKILKWPKGSEKNSVNLQVTHSGTGKPWMHVETLSAIPLKAPLDLGYRVVRKVTPVFQATPGSWKVGDIANVEIILTAKADQPWVVVKDAVPAGASHLGTGLDGSSRIMDQSPKSNNKSKNSTEIEDWPVEYEEKSFANFISYAAYLPRGTYRLNYRIRLNSSGEFKLPPVRVEAMYSPEMFGEAPNANWAVAQ